MYFQNETQVNKKKYDEFFKEFPISKIGGVVRLLFEFDVNEEEDNDYPEIKNESIEGINIPQIIIKITNANLETFFIDDELRKYFKEIYNHLKRKNDQVDNIHDAEDIQRKKNKK